MSDKFLNSRQKFWILNFVIIWMSHKFILQLGVLIKTDIPINDKIDEPICF